MIRIVLLVLFLIILLSSTVHINAEKENFPLKCRLIVDRIEGNYAVCESENQEMLDIPLEDIPFIPNEGDVLLVDASGIKLDIESMNVRRSKMDKLLDELWE